MIAALLAACIASSSHAVCKTDPLPPGTYKLIAADASHRTTFTVTTSNAVGAEHEATVEPYIGNSSCTKVAPIDGRFLVGYSKR